MPSKKKPQTAKTAPTTPAGKPRPAVPEPGSAPKNSPYAGRPAHLSAEKLAAVQKAVQNIAIAYSTEDEPILSREGGVVRWLMDIRAVFLQPETLDTIADLFWDIYQPMGRIQVGGMEVGAIPLVTAILTKAVQRGITTNGIILRKERKESGRTRIIEGTLNADPFVLVDDIINSGSSLEKCRVVLAREGITPRHAFVVVDFLGPTGLKWRAENGIEVANLFLLQDFGLSLAKDPAPLPTHTQAYVPSWRATVKGGNPFYVVPKSAPLLADGKVLTGSDSSVFVAFDAQTGAVQWQYECTGSNRKGILSSPAAHNGKVYFGAYNGNLYCLEIATGKLVWMQQLCEWIGSSPLIVPRHNALYIGLEYARPRTEGSVAAFDLTTGARLWESWTKTYQHGSAAYYEKADLVIFGTNDYTIAAHDAQKGTKVWEVNVRGAVKHMPAVDEARGLVVAGSFDGSIYVLDAATGARKAEVRTANVVYTTPLIAGKYAFCGSCDRHMYIINLETLELEKKIDTYARVMARPVRVGEESVIFGATNGRVMEINLKTLTVSGRVTVPDCVVNSVVVVSERKIVVPTHMNELYAFHRWSTPTGQAAKPLAAPARQQGATGPESQEPPEDSRPENQPEQPDGQTT